MHTDKSSIMKNNMIPKDYKLRTRTCIPKCCNCFESEINRYMKE